MLEILKNYINGEWLASTSSEWSEIRNPALDETIALYPMSLSEEVDLAVQAGQRAFQEWRSTPSVKRGVIMQQFRKALLERQDIIARTMVEEHGKTYADAIGEVGRALECVEYVCSASELSKGVYSANVAAGIDVYYILEPLGSFALLPPYNFPALLSCYFCWPVALGNTVIIKPPDLCPKTVIEIMKAVQASGFPPGVVNLVCGSAGVGQELCTHPGVVGVTFIGSSRVGEIVYKTATSAGKRAQIQAGAKNHIVVAEDANLKENIKGMVNAAYGSASQRCFAASNFLVHDSIYDEFVEMFIEESKRLKVGYGMEKDVDIGPLVSKKTLENAITSIECSEKEGAKVLLDGRSVFVKKYPNGYFMGPTLLQADEGMTAWRDEIFAPVRCVSRFSRVSEAISIINRSAYGHSAVIFTERGGVARHFVGNCNVGHVGVNVPMPVPMSFMSVGGRKRSFYGDLRGQGADAVQFCTDKKFVAQKWTTV